MMLGISGFSPAGGGVKTSGPSPAVSSGLYCGGAELAARDPRNLREDIAIAPLALPLSGHGTPLGLNGATPLSAAHLAASAGIVSMVQGGGVHNPHLSNVESSDDNRWVQLAGRALTTMFVVKISTNLRSTSVFVHISY